MPDYAALIAKWPSVTGANTAAKLANLNAQTVNGDPKPCILSPSQILNACVFTDLATLTSLQLQQLTLLLAGSQIDASPGTPIRAGIVALFSGKTQTLANLTALVEPFDNNPTPWWQATLAQGGGGLTGPVSLNDLAPNGLS